jgi:hypothetical protein
MMFIVGNRMLDRLLFPYIKTEIAKKHPRLPARSFTLNGVKTLKNAHAQNFLTNTDL